MNRYELKKNNIVDYELIDKKRSKKYQLPHGCGIDNHYHIIDDRLYSSYHIMNERGFYVGWVDFCIDLRKSDNPNDFRLIFTNLNSLGYYYVKKCGIREYLEDLFANTFLEC